MAVSVFYPKSGSAAPAGLTLPADYLAAWNQKNAGKAGGSAVLLDVTAGSSQVAVTPTWSTVANNVNSNLGHAQYCSAALAANSYSAGTWTFAFAGDQTNSTGSRVWRPYIALYLANGSTGAIRTTIFAIGGLGAGGRTSTTEKTGWDNTISGGAFTATAGDYLVLELGIRVGNTSGSGYVPATDVYDSGTTSIGSDNAATTDALSSITAPAAIVLQNTPRATTDAPSTSESLARTLVLARATTDAPNTSESIVRIITKYAATTDAPTTSEALTRTFVGLRATSEAPQTSENASRTFVGTRTLTAAPQTSESAAKVLTVARTNTDSPQTSESLARISAELRTTTDSPQTSEVVSKISSEQRTTNEYSGTANNCLSFDSTSTHNLNCVSTSDLQISGDTSFTGWWYGGSNIADNIVIEKTSVQNEYWIVLNDDNIIFRVFAADASFVTAYTSVTTGIWNFFTVWYDSIGQTINIAVNGGATTTVACVLTPLADNNKFYMAGGTPAHFMALVGKWSRVLTSGERTSIYNTGYGKLYSQLSGSEQTGCVAYWNLNEYSDGSGQVVRVDSVNGYNLTDSYKIPSTGGGPSSSESAVRVISEFRTATDSPTTSGVVTRTFVGLRTTSEIPQTSEVISRIFVGYRTTDDTPQTSESIARALSEPRAVTDNPATAESLSRIFVGFRAPTDSPTTSESESRVFVGFRTSTDAPTTSELVDASTPNSKSVQDALTISSSVNRLVSNARTTTDSPTTGESAARVMTESRILADNPQTSEGVARIFTSSRANSDTPSTSESATRAVVSFRAVVDVPSTSELVTRVHYAVATTSEAIVLSENLHRTLVGLRATSDSPQTSEIVTVVKIVGITGKSIPLAGSVSTIIGLIASNDTQISLPGSVSTQITLMGNM
jgi:hypothetical protein